MRCVMGGPAGPTTAGYEEAIAIFDFFKQLQSLSPFRGRYATRFNEACINTRADYLPPTAATDFIAASSDKPTVKYPPHARTDVGRRCLLSSPPRPIFTDPCNRILWKRERKK